MFKWLIAAFCVAVWAVAGAALADAPSASAPAAEPAKVADSAAAAAADDSDERPAPAFELLELPEFRVAYSEGTMAGDLTALYSSHVMQAMDAGLVTEQSHVWGAAFGNPMEVGPENVTVHACVSIADDAIVPEGMLSETLGGVWYMRLTHIGSYHDLGFTYQWGFDWLAVQNDYVFGEWPALEQFISDPSTTPEAELLTYVYLPVRLASEPLAPGHP